MDTKEQYDLGEEISDLGCRLQKHECGINKIFIIVAEYTAEHDSNIKGCIERCSCIAEYEEALGSCIKISQFLISNF